MSESHVWDSSKEKWLKAVSLVKDPESPESLDVKKKADLLFYEGEDKLVHFTDYLVEASQRVPGLTFNSGFEVFDRKLGGIETGEVVVVSGYMKNGKTTFAESWIYRILKANSKAAATYFSFEVKTDKLLIKYAHDQGLKIFVPRLLKSMDFQWLKDRILEGKLKHGCNLVFLDHLHYLIDMNLKQNMSLNIGAFMRRLKQEIAIELDVAVILIAHQGQSKEGVEAGAGTIRDSSFISQEADSIIIVSRRENYNAVEMSDYRMHHGEDKANQIAAPPSPPGYEDKYSSNLAIVKIEVARRLGTFAFKKLFQKCGDFMEEI